MADTNENRARFIDLLYQLFQLDRPLDFGLYRILHAKGAELTRFIDEELTETINQAFSGRAQKQAGNH